MSTMSLMARQVGCAAPPAKGLFGRAAPRLVRPRSRRSAVAVLSYRPDQQQQDRPSLQTEEGSSSSLEQQSELITAGDLTRASAEELRRCVLQLQADNAELQAEIQHLAGSLRAALETGTAAAAALGWQQAEQQDHDDTAGEQRQHAQQALQHHHGQEAAAVLHTHTLGHNGSISSGSWHASVDGGSVLASLDALSGAAAVPPYHQPTSVSHATLSCSMQHPGSICCSKLSSALDPGGAACTISLHTTSRCTADDTEVHRHLSPEELRALAAQALVGAAHAFSQAAIAEYRAKAGPPQDVAAAHADLVHVLEHGVVICAERTPPSQFDHKSYLLTLQDPGSARRVRAIYKPRVYGDAGGWHRTPMEWVAYRLNLLLGLDLVPPTAYRSAPLTLCLADEDEELVFQEGAMMLWVEGCKQLKEFPQEQWGLDPAVLLSDTRILDVLLHNSDRHHGHFLLGPHWARGSKGKGGPREGSMTPVLIDHAASFRREAVVSMEHENAFSTGPVRCVSASTYLRLRFLDSHTVAEELGAHLSRAEQRQLLHRRDYVLHYLDNLCASQGYAATVWE
ncbi:hypothetical protein ABPG75_003901 [Micractinium tetrahymenae]